MTRYTITPWKTQADLLQVRSQLYPTQSPSNNSPNPAQQRQAVDRIMAWKLRGNLPHAVESTALLVDAILHHHANNDNTNSAFSIRAVYSAAFTRFVTGFCDIGRHRERSLEPSSMLDIARQIDMPAEFVALRHEATHEELPGLQRLVGATRKALEWLWRVYWSRLEDAGIAEGKVARLSVALRAEIAAMLRGFRKARRDALKAGRQGYEESCEMARRTGEQLEAVCKDGRQLTDVLVELMVGERLIFPSDIEFVSSLQGAFLLWDDLIDELHTRLRDFVLKLGMALLKDMVKMSTADAYANAETRALSEWLLHLILPAATGKDRYESRLAPEVLKYCCLYPGHQTQKVGYEVLEACDIAFQSDWRDLFEASLVSGNGSGVPSDMSNGTMSIEIDSNTSSRRLDIDEVSSEGWTRAILPPSAPIGMVK